MLGEGPFGSAWTAIDPADEPVTVKLLRHTFACKPEGRAAFSRLRAAARAHRKVQHPYVAQTLGLIEDEHGQAYGVVSPQHEGFPLHQLQVSPAEELSDDPTELSRLLFFFEELGDALHWLHERRVVHGNLKPSNVLVQRGDFGIVPKVLDLTWSAIGVAASAENIFISPEQFGGQVPSAASDQWAFGMMLSTALGGGRREAGTRSLPLALQDSLQRMRSHEPRQRYASMKLVVESIRTTRSDLERARALSPARRFGGGPGLSPPVPRARSVGRDLSGASTEPTVIPMVAKDEEIRRAVGRKPEVSSHRIAPAALGPDVDEFPESPPYREASDDSVVLDQPSRAPQLFGLLAAAAAIAGLIIFFARDGSGPTPQANAEGGAQVALQSPGPSITEKPVDAPPASTEGNHDRPARPVSPETVPASAAEEKPDPEVRSLGGSPNPVASSDGATELNATEPEARRPSPRPATPPTRRAEPPRQRQAVREPSRPEAPSQGDCDLGQPSACLEAAAWYEGQGQDEDARRAFEAACDTGVARGCMAALDWWEGTGLSGADVKALVLLTKACGLNHPVACEMAAERTETGRGTSANQERARLLRAKACRLGRTAACP